MLENVERKDLRRLVERLGRGSRKGVGNWG